MRRSRFSVPNNWRFGFALLLLATCVVLGGCSREPEYDLLFAEDSPPVTLTYISPNSPLISEPEAVAIERFRELAPGIEIDRQTFQLSLSDYLLDTPPPDVILMVAGNELVNAGDSGLLSDLSDVWLEGNFAEAYGQPFQDLSRIDGAIRFVPAGFTYTGVYYNKEVFERYGLTPPANWEEFEQICDTLLTYGQNPMSLAGQNPFTSVLWFDYLNLRLNGPDFHRDLMAGLISFEDERVGRVWQLWNSLLDRDYFVESPGSTSELASLTALIRGDAQSPLNRAKAVMALAPHFSLAQLPPAFAGELGFFQFPQMDAKLPTGEVSIAFGYVIPAGAPNRLQAGKFVGFLGSAEAQELQLRRIGEDESNVGYVPVHGDFNRSLLSPTAAKGDQIVRSSSSISPPMLLVLPSSMGGRFEQVLRRLFPAISNRIQMAEIQSMLEEARQTAIRNGEFGQ
ncbi:MAG: ABC transporter substrate-binding protein [Caldilineaceae bacterium]|nr:ABC transporter substrate-binding protein [Caldilineaceae bacterium]